MAKDTIHDYAKALYEVTKDLKGAEQKNAVQAFAALLYQKNMVTKAGAISKAFEAYAKKQAGEVAITITAARELDKATLEQIKKTFGQNVETETNVDPSLIGGVVVRTEDTILDASLKKQLQILQAHLA